MDFKRILLKILFKIEGVDFTSYHLIDINVYHPSHIVQYASIPKHNEINLASSLSVCFERGGKMASSGEVSPIKEGSGWRANFN